MAAARGLGLAAPQVGVDLRVAVVEVAGARLELINPRIVGAHGRDRGCVRDERGTNAAHFAIP